VNHVICRKRAKDGKDKYSLVSRYIVLKISKSCELAFFSEAARLSIEFSNDAWDGWVFQIDFFMQLRRACTQSPHNLDLSARTPDDTPDTRETWVVRKQVGYRDPSDFVEKSIKVSDGDWLIPLRWNQACFDVVQVLPDNVLRIVQVTRADSHSLKLEYVLKLIMGLTATGRVITKLDIVVVVPIETLYDFHIVNSKVRGERLLHEFGWDLRQLRVLGLLRTKHG